MAEREGDWGLDVDGIRGVRGNSEPVGREADRAPQRVERGVSSPFTRQWEG